MNDQAPPDKRVELLEEQPTTVQLCGRAAGIILAGLTYPLLRFCSDQVTEPQAGAAAVTVLMAVWWMTEALPLAVTSLLPLILCPLLGVLSIEEAARPYADKSIFLFMGGFMIALAIEKWGLHRRLALVTVSAAGTNPSRLIGGVMLATGFTSMWISNTATAAMMLPIGQSLVTLLSERVADSEDHSSSDKENSPSRRFAVCMMLGIAYAASIGGMGTLIGTPTNVTLAGFAAKVGMEIRFASWMKLGMPLALIYLICAWILLTQFLFPIRIRAIPGGRELIRDELRKLGRPSSAELVVLSIFVATTLLWLLRQPLQSWLRIPTGRFDDSVIAMFGALALFVIPVDRTWRRVALDWHTAARLPWGVLLLFGGGFALAAAMQASGLDLLIGAQIRSLGNQVPLWLMVVAIVTIVVFFSELASNTPTAATFLPITYGVAEAIGVPALFLLVPVTLAASCGFMLPVATPPNAIAFGSGYVTIRQMIRAGWRLNLIGIALITLAIYAIGPWAFLDNQHPQKNPGNGEVTDVLER
ncbi:MAG: DASS family sodium-coupled anion symporter [Planctomycetes bacterium]|nr:DASS family sodium-coupled anion symporter [Planctomycetota bacterium]